MTNDNEKCISPNLGQYIVLRTDYCTHTTCHHGDTTTG